MPEKRKTNGRGATVSNRLQGIYPCRGEVVPEKRKPNGRGVTVSNRLQGIYSCRGELMPEKRKTNGRGVTVSNRLQHSKVELLVLRIQTQHCLNSAVSANFGINEMRTLLHNSQLTRVAKLQRKESPTGAELEQQVTGSISLMPEKRKTNGVGVSNRRRGLRERPVFKFSLGSQRLECERSVPAGGGRGGTTGTSALPQTAVQSIAVI
ncbi:hypothetical protein EGW08_017211 [Elysia chlorotica]|uniref:Uncharacterized protein n=1 Tax=Elysia chlorotica TaxID=188477 RepID=A0A3S1AXT6_ELYCH|nr:hypothetical protein EGW08_017211 [Elysia chlorotica]